MANDNIFIGIDNDRVELLDDDLTAFKAQRTKDRAEEKKIQALIDAKTKDP